MFFFEDIDKNIDEAQNEMPTRVMNIVNGFFPEEANKNFVKDHYTQLCDKSNWPVLNEAYLPKVNQVGLMARQSKSIPIDTLDHIIKNVRKVEKPNLNEAQIDLQMANIREFNNSQFDKYYNDPRLAFKTGNDNLQQVLDSNDREESYADKIKQYNAYRTEFLPLLLKNDCNHFDFTMNTGLCRFTVENLSEETRNVKLQKDFKNDDVFKEAFLEPSIVDFSKTNPVENAEISAYDNGLSQYMAFSESNKILTVSNIDYKYAEYLDQKVKNANPIVVQQQIDNILSRNQNDGGIQKVLTLDNAFSNTIMVSVIIGLCVLLVGLIIYLVMILS